VNELYVKNKGKTQRLVEIHVDSRSKGQNIDVFFYHDKRSATGKKLATNLHQTFKEKYNYHQPSRGYKGTVSDRNLYMLKYSYPPAVFIELGNINHRRDQQRFMITDNRQALANWLAEGLIKDSKNNR
jgi:N-acetylmuramoyl-L-alanine amidase